MSTSSIQVTSFPDSIGTKILCFGCDVPCEIQDHTALTLNDEHEDFDDPLTNQKLGNHQVMPPPTLDIGMLENVGIVGTVTFLGRSTAMVWVGWGRLLPKDHQDVDGDTTQQNLGAASNLRMGPLMVSMPRKTYQGAFASEHPSSKLISVSDLECDLMASQMSERLSHQLQMAILVSCHFDDTCAPSNAIGSEVENHMLRRRAMTIAEKEICQIVKQHQSQT